MVKPTTRCTGCGSEQLEDAQLEGMALRLNAASTMKKVFSVGGVVHCRVCLGCGALHDLRGDPAALQEMLK